MKKFEYMAINMLPQKISLIDSSGKKTDLTGITMHPLENAIRFLNEFGEAGWEMVTASIITGGPTMIFKREKTL